MTWFNASPEETLSQLHVESSQGLSNEDAQTRLSVHGLNQLSQASRVSWLALFFRQFKNPLILILILGAGLSTYTGHWIDAAAITVIIFINVLISFSQEFNAQKSIDALRDMAAPKCRVKRGGHWQELPASQLVPGDFIQLTAGNIVPADARLFKVTRLEIDESTLTGESEAVSKKTGVLKLDQVTLGDQVNMAFMSTAVTHGYGEAVVTATGMNTEVGKIAQLMSQTESRKTPLQQRIHDFSKLLIWVALSMVAIVIGIGLYDGLAWTQMINTGISLAVAAIPEGLPTVITIVLTLGANIMMRNQALAKQLSAVETLGSTTVICSDKTGTLTQNKMQSVRLWVGGEYFHIEGDGYKPNGRFLNERGDPVNASAYAPLRRTLSFSALCSDTLLVEDRGQYHLEGVPTEGAIVVAAAKAGLTQHHLSEHFHRVNAFPFDPKRKMMSVIVKTPEGEHFLLVKGAPDVVFKHSEAIECKEKRLDVISHPTMINDVIEEFAQQALRTLAIAYRPLEAHELSLPLEDLEERLIFVGIHGIIDPPRPDATLAIAQCRGAGVKVVMITGDHALTARAIALEMGIIDRVETPVVTGQELSLMNDTELMARVKDISVYARVTPEHKLRIVEALQAHNEVVAMTGDGVNDAPALRKADIGIAMGITGTDVAKESADLILLDDNFATIVSAVREGRRIYDNIRKFIRQDLTTNVGEVSAILFAFIVMSDAPLLTLAPLMILWVNLVSDGLPSLALGVDTPENDVMKRQPRLRSESFFTDHLGARIIIRGLIMGGVAYWMFEYALSRGNDLAYAQTLAFMTLIFGQLVHAFDARTFTTLYHRNPFSNRLLVLAVLGSAALSLMMVYFPWGNIALGTVPLLLNDLVMVFFIGALPTFILSALKAMLTIRWL